MSNNGYVLLLVLICQSFFCKAQQTVIDRLVKGTWTISKIWYSSNQNRHYDSTSGPYDSIYYQFRIEPFECYGFQKMPSVVRDVWSYKCDSVTGNEKLIKSSDPDDLGFVGKFDDSSFHIIVCGGHDPYLATIFFKSEVSFDMASRFQVDDNMIMVFRRIKTPAFLPPK